MLTVIEGIFCVGSPGWFPCANWLLAVAQNLPPPDPPNQSEANASFTVMHFSYNLFSDFKTSSTSGSQAAIWSACWPILEASSATWSCGYNLRATSNLTSLANRCTHLAAELKGKLKWLWATSKLGLLEGFRLRHVRCPFLLFMKDKLLVL